MKIIPVVEAVGTILCHDITEIVPGKTKGRAFKKGHIVQKEDISKLLDLGKEHLYVWEIDENNMHENDAALCIAKSVAGKGIVLIEPTEGKVELKAETAGLLKINVSALMAVNDIEEVVVATLHSNQVVSAGAVIAGCRAVPLVIDKSKIKAVEAIGNSQFPIIEVMPLMPKKIGIVTTGSEVYHERIADQFGPVLKQKIAQFGSHFLRQVFVPDDASEISEAIRSLISDGADMILTTGGMSVDPDDVTPAGIREAGGQVILYGAPVLPGSMFMLAYLKGIPILGLPGCVMYHKTTIFDLLFPRILAGEELTRRDIVALGHGGLCTNCSSCKYPNCSFGKGS